VIYNLIEVYLLEYRYTKAKKMIHLYKKNYDKLETFDKEISYYDEKIKLFDSFVANYGNKSEVLTSKKSQ